MSNYEAKDPQVVNEFLSLLNVGDFTGGQDSVAEVSQLYTKAMFRMKEGFNLQ